MGASTQTSAHGRTHNPHDARRSAGGSSGGCAAAVAAHEAVLSVGTDTGGSVREPAAQCGVVGMAPTPGVVPLRGVVPFAPELDRAGPLARTVPDTALLLSVLGARPGLARAVDDLDVRGLQVGVLEELWARATRPGCCCAGSTWSWRRGAGWGPGSCRCPPRRQVARWRRT